MAILAQTEESERARIITAGMETYSRGAHLTECSGGGNKYHPRAYTADLESFLCTMDGKGIDRMATEILPRFVAKLLHGVGLTIADIDMKIPLQASLMALRLMCKQLEIPATEDLRLKLSSFADY